MNDPTRWVVHPEPVDRAYAALKTAIDAVGRSFAMGAEVPLAEDRVRDASIGLYNTLVLMGRMDGTALDKLALMNELDQLREKEEHLARNQEKHGDRDTWMKHLGRAQAFNEAIMLIQGVIDRGKAMPPPKGDQA